MRSLRLCLIRSRGAIAPQIIDALARAFERVGHKTTTIDFEKEGLYSAPNPEEQMKQSARIIEKLKSAQPDFAISYGMGGIIGLPDKFGANLFEALKIPYLLLCYDSPIPLENALARLIGSRYLRVLCWDRRYIGWLAERGVKLILKQPHGTDPQIFGAARPSPRDIPGKDRVVFVGSLPKDALKRGISGTPPLQSFAKAFLALKLREPCRPFRELLGATQAALPDGDSKGFENFKRAPGNGFLHFCAELTALADALYRMEAINATKAFRPAVFGGGSWFETGLQGVEALPPVPYGPQLAELYASAAVNLNISNAQLEGSVNQRPFDCAAAGGFLLSDWREELPELFDPETEIPSFKTLPELAELLARYSSDRKAREKMAAAARKRALACHTWDIRAAQIATWLDETRLA